MVELIYFFILVFRFNICPISDFEQAQIMKLHSIRYIIPVYWKTAVIITIVTCFKITLGLAHIITLHCFRAAARTFSDRTIGNGPAKTLLQGFQCAKDIFASRIAQVFRITLQRLTRAITTYGMGLIQSVFIEVFSKVAASTF